MRYRSLAVLLITVALLGGCASTPPVDAFAPIETAAQQQLGKQLQRTRNADDQAALEQRVSAMLATPLTVDDAVQLALLNNRGLQAAFAELGVAEADREQAGRWPNPGFSFSRMSGDGELTIERGLHFGIGRLLALPQLREVQAQRLAQTQHQVVLQMLTLAQDTRRAWVHAVAAQEALRYAEQVNQAAEAGAELARRMARAGNFNALQQSREQAFHAEAALNIARAQQALLSARERLTRRLGLWGDAAQRLRLPDRLPELPREPRELPDAEQTAIAQRLDLQAARRRVDEAASELAAAKGSVFSYVTEVGVVKESASPGHRSRGWEVGIELPIFDNGSARVARAEAQQQQARHRAAELAINARSEVREAYAAYRHAWDIARHQRDEVLPLARRISQENLLRYNGMLIGVFELLADARAQVAAVNNTLDALRDFWLAQAELDLALYGPAQPSSTAATPSRAAAAAADAH